MSKTIKAGVAGLPVAHSLSPRLHNYWLKKYNIPGEYKAYEVKPEDLENFIRSLPANGFAGCNLTIPHKEAALKFLDTIDDLALAVGAVNTIIVKDGKTIGTNTDVAGFYENILPHIKGSPIKDKQKAVVLGAGGASRAIIVALKQLGFGSIVLVNRSADKAQALAKQHALQTVSWEERESVLTDADLIVNTTSLGLAGQPPLEISLAQVPKHTIVTDVVYYPLKTPLLKDAEALGLRAVDGLGMLLHQAAPGFAAWFGVTPEVTPELRNYVLAS